MALGLKMAELNDYITIHGSGIVTDNAAFGIYTGTLAFVLVFRTNKCYSRFWHCATSCCTLRAQLVEAASSLVCFTFMSNHPEKEVDHFQRTIVSLTSMLHAAALANVCNRPMSEFPIIGMNALDKKFRDRLHEHNKSEKVDVIYMWMNGLIVRSLKSGLLNVPPPILSRVFQETEKAMVEYNQVLEVMMIPFPFPYAQTAYFLLLLLGLFTPFAMCSWTNHPVSCTLLAFIAVVCLTSLELIASELENPFGTDANDLPVFAFQEEMNTSLSLMLEYDAQETPLFDFELDGDITSATSPTASTAGRKSSKGFPRQASPTDAVEPVHTPISMLDGKGAPFGPLVEDCEPRRTASKERHIS